MVSTEKSVVLPGFFEEVRRRKVYRVAAAYVIAAGGIIQLASAAFPAWELPSWTLRVLIVCLLIGISGRAHACVGVRHYRGWHSEPPLTRRRPGRTLVAT